MFPANASSIAGAQMSILVTGGCGFIGTHLVQRLRHERPELPVVNLDALTYAGNLENHRALEGDPGHRFIHGDVTDAALLGRVIAENAVDAVIHLAAESHVDRSVESAQAFVRTNVLGTQALLDACREAKVGKVVIASTDEVYGSIAQGKATEAAPLAPSSPYAASKAAADLLALAAYRTHALPVVITRGSNTYGPFQFPEKLIPLCLRQAEEGAPVPLYGDGQQVRDWLHVEDHCRGLLLALDRGRPGEIYNLSGGEPRANLALVEALLDLLDRPRSLIRFVEDRPGHDRRYAIDDGKARSELGFSPRRRLGEGLAETVRWYRDHAGWLAQVTSGEYRDYFARQYRARLER